LGLVTRIAVPALVVMLTVVTFVAAAGWNASREPRMAIHVTERELPLVHVASAPGDDPGLQLRIAYENRHEPLDSRNWLPEPRLHDIGFALHVPPGSPRAVDAYDHVPARVAWVVFEYDGPRWRDIERRRALLAQGADPRQSAGISSRLVPVDAGLNFDALRARYPTGHVILRGVIGLTYVRDEQTGPFIHGTLRELVPPRVAVPHHLRGLLDGVGDTGSPGVTAPRYDAELAVGALGLPYIRALRLRANGGGP
jgi:hypothetical protein